ncbi:unnamed protein product, partial [Mesorhabditis spiculigera]
MILLSYDTSSLKKQTSIVEELLGEIDLEQSPDDVEIRLGIWGIFGGEKGMYKATAKNSPEGLCDDLRAIRTKKEQPNMMNMTDVIDALYNCTCMHTFTKLILLSLSDDPMQYENAIDKYEELKLAPRNWTMWTLQIIAATDKNLTLFSTSGADVVQIPIQRRAARFALKCTVASTCDRTQRCGSTSTIASTTPKPTTAIRSISTTTLPPVTPLPPVSVNVTSGCPCVPEKLWLDVMLLIDNADSLPPNDLEAIEEFFETIVLQMSLGQGIGQHTRIGLVTYASEAELVYPLTYFNSSTQFLDEFKIPWVGGGMLDLYKGLRLTVDYLEANARPNVRQGVGDPTQLANIFNQDNVIITIGYKATHGDGTAPALGQFAKPHYNLTTDQLHASPVINLLCEANCFCADYWQPYQPNIWQGAENGCYKGNVAMRNYPDAQASCRADGGAMVSIEDEKKAAFIGNDVPMTLWNANTSQYSANEALETDFFIGAYCVGDLCTWDDGRPFGNYTPWENSPDEQQGEFCVVQSRISLIWYRFLAHL